MKKLYILSPLVIGIGLIALMSVAGGVAKIQKKDRTGSPVSTTNCTACHSSGNSFSLAPEITINDSTGPVTKYIPLKNYTLKLSLPSSGNVGHGFQVTGLLSDNTVAGLASAPSLGTQNSILNSRWYFENAQQVTGGVYTITWTAPQSGSGDVTFYGSALATNGNGRTSGDDYENIPNFVITESAPAGITDVVSNTEVKLFPNPVIDELHINSNGSRMDEIQILSVTGKLLKRVEVNASSAIIDVSSFPKGVYFVQINANGVLSNSTFVKE